MWRYGALALLLMGCAEAQSTADEIARQQAKQVVNAQVATVLPGIDVSFATDCIIDNASFQEIFTLARASVTGVDAATGQLITDIAQRPETTKCITEKALSRLF